MLLNLLSRDRLDDETWDEMEEVLITADVGVAVARVMVDDLRTKVKVLGVRGPAEVRELLREELLTQLGDEDRLLLHVTPHGGMPAVVLMVGVNGTGKTTTCAELSAGADRRRRNGPARRGRHLPRGGRRPAADLGRAGGRRDGPG